MGTGLKLYIRDSAKNAKHVKSFSAYAGLCVSLSVPLPSSIIFIREGELPSAQRYPSRSSLHSISLGWVLS